MRERNRLITQEHERERARAGFGQSEFEDRDLAVRATITKLTMTDLIPGADNYARDQTCFDRTMVQL